MLKGLALYAFLHVLRFTLILLMMPLAHKLGLGVTLGKAAVLTLGSVKGGFNIVLALVAHYNLSDRKVGDLFLLHAVLQLVLTNLINIPLLGLLVRKF